MHINDAPPEEYAEPLPRTNDIVETYSKSYSLWIPATVTARARPSPVKIV
jgi:hypothetical protein